MNGEDINAGMCSSSQVWPVELEGFLRRHPAVADVAVIGIPDDVYTEVPRAYIVKHEGVEVTEDDLVQHLNGTHSSRPPTSFSCFSRTKDLLNITRR